MLILNFNPFPNLATQRFILRAPALYDDEAFLILRSDPLVNQFLNRPPTTTAAAARQFIERIQANIAANQSLYWVITTKENDVPIGTICYWNIVPELDRAEIGYELQSAFFRKGIMQEVLPVVIQFGFEQLHLQKITAFPAVDNERSVKLLERYHFIKDDPLREELEKEEDLSAQLCYSLSKPL
ncbi:GNAT family N-acetyltransferase [Chitinophaga sp.]|uniref:GNAT family N-acetyltransferase n=1 Tax=Chitinophaga sp. TaxID=1869181 RepID=UPI002F937A9E